MEEQNTTNEAKLYGKIAKLYAYLDKQAPRFAKDGYNEAQKYDYVKTDQYKTIFRKGCMACGLTFKIDIIEIDPFPLSNTATKVTAAAIRGRVILVDNDTGCNSVYLCAAIGADVLDKQISKAETLMIKDFIKANFLIGDNDSDVDPEADLNATQAQLGNEPTNTPSKPLNATERKEIANKIVNEEPDQDKLSKAYDYAIKLYIAIENSQSGFAPGLLDKLKSKGYPNMLDLKRVINRLEELAEENGLSI